MVNGAATCFWAFSGFEMISCAVEESRNPRRDIPVATFLTMFVVTFLYLGVSAGLTLMIPYTSLDTSAPLPSAFSYHSLVWGYYIVAIGPLCGFTTALLSATYGFVRTALAMAEDGLLFSWFSEVNNCTHVPVVSVLFCGLLQAVIAFAFDIRDLIAFSVNLLFLSYCTACVCVIVLRYKQQYKSRDNAQIENSVCQQVDRIIDSSVEEPVINLELCNDESMNLVNRDQTVCPYSDEPVSLHSQCQCLEPLIFCAKGRCFTAALLMMLLCMLGLALTLVYGVVPLEAGVWWSVTVVTLTSVGAFLFLSIICIHRQTLQDAALKLPCVPLVPSVAVLLCLILLVSNSTRVGWFGCMVLVIIAVVQYFVYGIRHSKLNTREICSLTTFNNISGNDAAKEHLLSHLQDSGDDDDEFSEL
jgi:amino acid transporter